jgi:hypothetical protein
MESTPTHSGQDTMTDYGGMGGIKDGRPLDETDAFEMAVSRALGEQMKTDEMLCQEVWSALANCSWEHQNGDTASYTWRAAGDLIAAVIGRGDYMDWYMSGPDGEVSDRVAEAMEKEGWKAE